MINTMTGVIRNAAIAGVVVALFILWFTGRL